MTHIWQKQIETPARLLRHMPFGGAFPRSATASSLSIGDSCVRTCMMLHKMGSSNEGLMPENGWLVVG
jgi:hypothetical protein